MDHTDELEELCQAANHLNESGGESGGEFWLKAEEKKAKNVPEVQQVIETSSADFLTTNTTSYKSVTDLVVI